MPIPPYASLTVSIAGGAPQTGAVTALNSQSCQLAAASTAFWQTARWEIFAFPSGFTVPAGWTDDTLGTYYYLGIGPPPVFNLPALGTWGKFLFRLTVNNGLTNGVADATLKDESTAVQILSPGGLYDIAAGESTQFSATRKWVKAIQDNWRTIDTLIGGSGSPVFTSVSAGTSPFASTGDWRGDKTLTFKARNSINDRDLGILSLDGADGLSLGDSNVAQITHNVKSGGTHLWQVNGSNAMVLGSTSLSFQSTSTVQWVAGISSPALKQADASSGAGQAMSIRAQKGFTGNIGGSITVGGGDGATPGTNKAGDTNIELGQAVSNVSAKLNFWKGGSGGAQLGYTAGTGAGTLELTCDGSTPLFVNSSSAVRISNTGTQIYDTSSTVTMSGSTWQYNDTGANQRFKVTGNTSAQFSVPFVEFDGQISCAVSSQAFTATPTFDFSLGNNHAMAAATANITSVTLSNPRSGAVYTIMCTQDGTGTRTIAWPGTTRFNGTDATFGSSANNVTVWTFLYDGSVFRCISSKVFAT